MRTTLTLDEDVARLVKDAMHRDRQPMKTVINDAIRRGLAEITFVAPPFEVEVHDAALMPGIDPSRLNQLADELADDDAVARLRTP